MAPDEPVPEVTTEIVINLGDGQPDQEDTELEGDPDV